MCAHRILCQMESKSILSVGSDMMTLKIFIHWSISIWRKVYLEECNTYFHDSSLNFANFVVEIDFDEYRRIKRILSVQAIYF